MPVLLVQFIMIIIFDNYCFLCFFMNYKDNLTRTTNRSYVEVH